MSLCPPGTQVVSVPDAQPPSWRTERFDQAAGPLCEQGTPSGGKGCDLLGDASLGFAASGEVGWQRPRRVGSRRRRRALGGYCQRRPLDLCSPQPDPDLVPPRTAQVVLES